MSSALRVNFRGPFAERKKADPGDWAESPFVMQKQIKFFNREYRSKTALAKKIMSARHYE